MDGIIKFLRRRNSSRVVDTNRVDAVSTSAADDIDEDIDDDAIIAR
jgi:hypothetical protein